MNIRISLALLISLFVAPAQAQVLGGVVSGIANYYVTPEQYGAVCNGNTANAAADTTAITSALQALYTAGGGTLLINSPASGHGSCVVNASLLLPNSNPGSGVPTQPNIRITGAAPGFFDGSWSKAPTGGSTIKFIAGTYSTAKIDTRGVGTLEIDHLTLTSTDTAGGIPFIQTTNTTLKAHDNSLVGANAATAANENGIVLGGCTTCTGTIDGSATSEFQGYGTAIISNYMSNIRHMAEFNTYANGIVMRDNICSTSCGSSTANDGAIVLNGGTVSAVINFVTGNLLEANLVEAVHYSYMIKVLSGQQNEIIANNAYDNSSLTATVLVDSNSVANLVIGGTEAGGASLYLSDSGSATTYISISSNNQSSKFGYGIQAGNSTVANLFGATKFNGGAGGVIVQPAAASSTNSILETKRSAAEGTNPSGSIFQFNNDGSQNWGNNAGSGNITNALSSGANWSANGKTWGFPGATGGAMSINSGTGGSILTLQNFEILLKDHTGATQGRFYSSACGNSGQVGFDLGASFDTSICRTGAAALKTVGSLTIGGLVVDNGYTVSTLPTGITGAMAYVTDATACTRGSTPTGGGSTFCQETYNGTAWVAQ